MSWLERVVTPGGEYHKPLADLEDDVFLDIGATRGKTTKFWMQLVLASIIAAGGVIGDATPAVIGAMIIAPLGTPIYGLALAAVIGDRRALRSSLRLLLSGIAVNILIGVIIGLITVNRMPIDVNPQILGRTAPTVLDLTVAIAVGVAGSFALARRDVADILAGVAIAISLVPVLAVVGITLGAGHFSLALGAFVLFLTNAAAILIAGAVVFKAAGYAREAVGQDERAGRRARVAIIILVVVLLVPLAASSAPDPAVSALLQRREGGRTAVARRHGVEAEVRGPVQQRAGDHGDRPGRRAAADRAQDPGAEEGPGVGPGEPRRGLRAHDRPVALTRPSAAPARASCSR